MQRRMKKVHALLNQKKRLFYLSKIFRHDISTELPLIVIVEFEELRKRTEVKKVASRHRIGGLQ